jgi:hypothetical protein
VQLTPAIMYGPTVPSVPAANALSAPTVTASYTSAAAVGASNTSAAAVAVVATSAPSVTDG